MSKEYLNLDEISKVLYNNYVKERQFSIIDRLSRAPSKLAIIEVLYDAVRGIKEDDDRSKFKKFVDSIEKMKDSDAVYYSKLLALKALSGE
jgi:hypothetical protein